MKKGKLCHCSIIIFVSAILFIMYIFVMNLKIREGISVIDMDKLTSNSVEGYNNNTENESWEIVTDELADKERMTPPEAFCSAISSSGNAIKKMGCAGLNEYNCNNVKCCSFINGSCKAK